ncbi:MAG: ArnT family glycosyltransferase [Myxococcota bacterium]
MFSAKQHLPWLAVALGAALVISPLWVHVDDTDANLYRVVTRHMVEDGTWFELRYLPNAYPVFREHLPFGLWPYAFALRVVGEVGFNLVAPFWTIATLLLVAWVGRRLAGHGAALVAMLALGLNETFAFKGGISRLDAPLLFFATAATIPVLLRARALSMWGLAALCAALAACIKGPFGLLPLVAATTARAVLEGPRAGIRTLAWGAVATVLATLPVAGFLVWNRYRGDGTWWEGYVQNQVLASAMGARADGVFQPWYPFVSVAGRFWPGLPLAGLALFRLRGSEQSSVVRLLGLMALLVLLGLCLPSRKEWNHVLVAYPALALLGGAGVGPWLDDWLASAWRQRAVTVVLGLLALLGWGVALAGGARFFHPPITTPCTEFSRRLETLEPETPLYVVGANEWRTIASLAAHWKLSPWLVEQLPIASSEQAPQATFAFVEADRLPSSLGPWREVERHHRWVLLERRPQRALP